MRQIGGQYPLTCKPHYQNILTQENNSKKYIDFLFYRNYTEYIEIIK